MNDQTISTGCFRQRGFTMIELLITISIMVILGAAMAFAVSGAQESANIAKTRGLIDRLHVLVMQKYESYRTRRLPIMVPPNVLDAAGNSVPTPVRAIAKVRCDAVRQLMCMEMPGRWTDITDDPSDIKVVDPATWQPYYEVVTKQPAIVKMQRPSSSTAYLASYMSVAKSNAFLLHGEDHPSAKCLYLLVTMGLEENYVMENLSEGDIADVDQTGCKVFLDGWGNPIEFVRWAPGFVSPLQPAAPASASQQDRRGRDQTDPTGIYSGWVQGGTFALYPLIYSAGPDGNHDVVYDTDNTIPFHYANWNNNPFVGFADGPTLPASPWLAPDKSIFTDGPFGSAAVLPKSQKRGRALGNSDNIHNHMIGAR